MEVIFVMWGISVVLIMLTMCFEYYIEKLDESRPLKKWWRKHVIGDLTNRLH
jgi:hypothetical protein